MHRAMQLQLQSLKNTLARQAEVLHAVSPLSTLGRGYSIVTNEAGEAIKDSQRVKVGDTIYTQLHNGSLSSTVTQSNKSK